MVDPLQHQQTLSQDLHAGIHSAEWSVFASVVNTLISHVQH